MQFGALSTKTLLLFRLSSSSVTAAPRRPISVIFADFSTISSSFSTGAGSGSGFSPPRRPPHDEESRNVRVSVWWDFENCHLPTGANAFKLAEAITTAVRSCGIKGPISITAFGDILQLSRTNHEALSATGITLTHVPQGGKNSADRSLIIDLLWWVSQNPPPVHLFLISGDRDFANVLHKLRMNNYNILLASKNSAPGVLCSAATIVWDWNSLAKGETATAKHYNQPPDGPYHSWYGHYKVPLLDPFATKDQSSCTKNDELSEPNSNSDLTVRPIPKEVVNQILVILDSYPKGASIVELRAELIRNKVPMDRDFYGYKKFARFLQSMTGILKVYPTGDGHYSVHGITQKASMQLGSSASLSGDSDKKVTEKEIDNTVSPKVNNDAEVANLAAEARRDDTPGKIQLNIAERDKHVKKEVQELEKNSEGSVSNSKQGVKFMDKPMKMDIAVEARRGDKPGKIQKNIAERDEHVKEEAQEIEKKSEERFSNNEQGVKVMDRPMKVDSEEEDGFVHKLKRLWFGSSESESAHPLENKHVDMEKVKDKVLKPDSLKADPMTHTSPSTSLESANEVKASAFEGNEISGSPGFFNRILRWFKSLGVDTSTAEPNHEAREIQELVDVNSQAHAIFANDTFWSDMEAFISSPRGFIIVTHSKTREEMAKNLQKEGLSCLKSLNEPDMLHLVDLLISEKKWVEQNPSDYVPFGVSIVTKKGSNRSRSHAANGLRSIFLDSSKSQSEEQDEKRSKNVAHAGVTFATTMDQKPPERSRSDVFMDCQKLVKKLIHEHPEGYNMGSFRKDFLEEYGYHLDVQKLGYKKLQSLVEIIPGARIESGFIVPLTPSPDAKSFDKCEKNDDADSSFDELGPVSDDNEKKTMKKSPEYEPSLSEDEDSDSETDAVAAAKKGINGEKKQNMRGEDKGSSLIQILDSWYSHKEGNDKREKLEDMVVTKLVHVRGTNGKKQKPTKTYSFVTDSNGNNNEDKLIDGILGTLKKSGKSSGC